MPFLTWSDEKFSIKVTEVDDQHKHLVSLLNRMHEIVVEGAERTALGQVLNELIDYTVYHFRTEEVLFKEHNFPLLNAHKREHDALTKQVLELQAQFEEGSATISYEVLDFLHDWLVTHMAGSDRAFLYFLETSEL